MRLSRHKLPPRVAADIRLEPGERVLESAEDEQGRALVATSKGLILQRRPPDYERLDWALIEQAVYVDQTLSLLLVGGGNDTPIRLNIPIGSNTNFPIAVRDRVTASIVVNQHHQVGGSNGIRVVARRRDGDAGLIWSYVPDAGSVLDAEARRLAAGLVEQVRQESALD